MHRERRVYRDLEVPVEIRGSSQDTLVFLPGLGVATAHYAAGLDALAARFRVVTPDLSFRRRAALPRSTEEYLDLLTEVTDDIAPGAVWVGHSFGALLALTRAGPAIACAPSVPAEVGLPRMLGRAMHQQLREYAGMEGRRGAVYAARVLFDYVTTAATRPGRLFPVVASLRSPPEAFPLRADPAVVFLCDRDELYRDHEYRAYFDGGAFHEIRVPDCHDWPILEPARLAERVGGAYDRIRGEGSEPAGSAGASP